MVPCNPLSVARVRNKQLTQKHRPIGGGTWHHLINKGQAQRPLSLSFLHPTPRRLFFHKLAQPKATCQ